MSNTDNSLDSVIVQLGGFGCYQARVMILLTVATTLSRTMYYGFVFTTKTPNYRCRIPQCDNATDSGIEFNPSWLSKAVPFNGRTPDPCQQYQYSLDRNHTSESCDAKNFNISQIITCQNGFVYDTDKTSIVNDFDIHCDENTWKLTIVGTIHFLGNMVGLPISGILSDRFGRRTILIYAMFMGALIGIIQSFSLNYLMFVILEFTWNLLASGIYSCAYIISIELVEPSKRVFCGMLISMCTPAGGIITALLAWWITTWRMLFLSITIPGLLVISYKWLVPESVRWLLSQGHYNKAKKVLAHVADINQKTVSQHTLDSCLHAEENYIKDSLLNLLKSSILRWRFIICCYCWITSTFVYFGITLNSMTLAGNSYLDFILNNLVEFPSNIIACFIVEKLGRRITQCSFFVLAGITSLICVFPGTDNYYLLLFVTLLGKFGITAAFTITYLITSEVFPTPMRHTTMGACSMIGRIGSMISSQIPLLAQLWKPMPVLLFSLMSITAGLLTFAFPETLKIKLPDTILTAENMSNNKKIDGCENGAFSD